MASPSLALGFIRNDGQWDQHVRFTTTASGLSAGILNDGFLLSLLRSRADRPEDAQGLAGGGSGLRVERAPVQFTFEGASTTAQVQGEGLLEPYVNYFVGRDPARWATRVPTYAAVRYHGLYPGVDVVVKKPDARIEYDLVLAGEADPALVRVRVQGAESLALDETGGLSIQTRLGVLRQHPPLAFETLQDGSQRPVECFFVLLSDELFGFRVPAREPGASLVIDPVLDPPSYFTYLGGPPPHSTDEGGDMATDIAVKGGKATVTGCTASVGFPMTPDPGEPVAGSFMGVCDVFVTRLDSSGTNIRWSTFWGDNDIDIGYAVEVDGPGAVYVGGYTRSYDIQMTAPYPGPFQPYAGGAGDGFVLKLDASGSTISYSSYLGSSCEDTVCDLKVDGLGHAYVCGYTNWVTTWSPDPPFPTGPAAVVEPRTGGNWSGFVSKVAPDGTALVYSTFVRGLDLEMTAPWTWCIAIALHIDDSDPTNVNAFVTGLVENAATHGIPITATNAFQQTPGGGGDAFLIGLNASATSYVYGSYYGGSSDDIGFDLAAYSDGLAVTGRTYSTNLHLVAPYQGSNGGAADAFVARFLPYANPSVSFSTYLGGTGEDFGTAMDADSTGRNLYCTGVTWSTDFPTAWPLFSANQGLQDVFFSRFQSNALVSSTYLGGAAADEAYGLATDQSGYYIAGLSVNHPTLNFYTVLNAAYPVTGWQTTHGGGDLCNPSGWQPDCSC
ncbi:MAG: SBBP repeat-containing protein [Planctomycetes bacterium]|nr:SBBP repeat-containing protein [Planctomycetota bacterium]